MGKTLIRGFLDGRRFRNRVLVETPFGFNFDRKSYRLCLIGILGEVWYDLLNFKGLLKE